MRIDLLPYLVEAKLRSSNYPSVSAGARLKAIAHALPGAVSDWDDGAGEEWGRILKDRSVIAMVRVDIPFAVLIGSSPSLAHDVCEHQHLVTLTVNDLDTPAFTINIVEGGKLLPHWRWESVISPLIDPDCLSASELWYATV